MRNGAETVKDSSERHGVQLEKHPSAFIIDGSTFMLKVLKMNA